MRLAPLALVAALAVSACSTTPVGRAPEFSPIDASNEYRAMAVPTTPAADYTTRGAQAEASLWTGGPRSLLGDRRASQQGDILTVVIDINERAQIRNQSSRSRSGSENMGVNSLFGLPEKVPGVQLDPGIGFESSSEAEGNGSVRRNEQLELRVAATVVNVLLNGVLQIQGSQEVRVNFEIRELLVTGYVRPEDISRVNEVTYDKIASARISYGGRGQITDMQQPRYGQQVVDRILPF